MVAYAIFDTEVTDPETYEEYRRLSRGLRERYGATLVVPAGRVEALEGDWRPQRLAVLRFDSVEQARAWYDSPEYTAARKVRQRSAKTRAIIVEGV